MNESQAKYNDIPYFILPKDRVVSSFNFLKGNNSPKKRKAVPLSEKYTLSIEEASQYFGIGHVRLRNISIAVLSMLERFSSLNLLRISR